MPWATATQIQSDSCHLLLSSLTDRRPARLSELGCAVEDDFFAVGCDLERPNGRGVIELRVMLPFGFRLVLHLCGSPYGRRCYADQRY